MTCIGFRCKGYLFPDFVEGAGISDLRNYHLSQSVCFIPVKSLDRIDNSPADIEQLELVLLNIIKNAAEAIENDGEITVITASDPEKRLIIRDTGPGLSPETAGNLFTPFFSTKKDGQGIGLTLAREILTSHGFYFSLKMVRQNCTEFTIIFP